MSLVIYTSRRILVEGENEEFSLVDGGILVQNGKIDRILYTQEEINSFLYSSPTVSWKIDFDESIIMPGLIDSHVHINEPGREEWEGFETATKAAAAGGFTSLFDMPLNSIPPTTTLCNLKTKINVAEPKLYVNCGFWGGVIPGNERNLSEMARHGVVGFKCFLCPSGVEEFPNVTFQELEIAMERLQGLETVLAFHAEVENGCCSGVNGQPKNNEVDSGDPKSFYTFMQTRPASMELEAIKKIIELTKKYDIRTHIVHLAAGEALPLLKQAKQHGVRITVETCHHYLFFNYLDIPHGRTDFKSVPPIRDAENQRQLWEGLKDGTIDFVVSDHSPSTPGMKLLISGKNRGNFVKAWGGISSVQFGLSTFWTSAQAYGFQLHDIVQLLCKQQAQLCGFGHVKGKIAVGYDADFCVFNPDEEFEVSPEIIHFKNKATPYMGIQLKGVVRATIVGGNVVYENGKINGPPVGKILLRGKHAIERKIE